MQLGLRDFLLKTIPYMLSIVGGLVLFIVTKDDVHDPNVTDLINNIAASLLSIPVVFLLYDYTNYRVSKQLKKTLADNMGDKINALLLNLTLILRQIMGMRGKLTFVALNKMGDISVSHIASHVRITPSTMKGLRQCRDELNDLVYNSANTNVLSADQIQTLSILMRELSQLINEHDFRRNHHIAAKYIKNIIGHIMDWIDSDALAAMHFQQLLGNAEITLKNKN